MKNHGSKQTRITSGITVVFDASEQDTAELIADTVDKVLCLIQEKWGLNRPQDCRIYIMTFWWDFFFRSAPWPWKIMLVIALPLWSLRAQRVWPYSAAWTQRYGRRVAIGIKPPWLLEVSDKSIGVHMYVDEKDTNTKVRHVTCHELTHACSAHLKLPAWLNEGIAQVTVDCFLEKRTIRTDTLELVQSFTPKGRPPTYRELSRMGGKTLAYHAVRGYWLVRFLEDQCPGFLKRKLISYRESRKIEDALAVEMELEPDSLWSQIDDRLVAHFQAMG